MQQQLEFEKQKSDAQLVAAQELADWRAACIEDQDCLTKQQASLLHAFVEAGKSTLELLWGKGLADSPAARQLAHALHAAWLAHVAAAANLRTGTPDLHHAAPADMPRPAEMFTASEVDATWVPALDATFSTNDEGQDSATDVLLPHLNPQHSCASAWIQQGTSQPPAPLADTPGQAHQAVDRADTATNALATQSAQLSDGSSCEERACWQAGSKPHGVTIVTATPVVSDICSNEQQAEAETEGSRAVWTPKWHSIVSDSGDTDSACKERMPESKTIFGCGNAEDSIEDMQLSQCTPPLPPLQASCTSACSIDTFSCQGTALEGAHTMGQRYNCGLYWH